MSKLSLVKFNMFACGFSTAISSVVLFEGRYIVAGILAALAILNYVVTTTIAKDAA